MTKLIKNKKFIISLFIIIIGFCVYWFWPQPQIQSIIDEGQHINQETRKIIEEDNAKNQIKTQYIVYNETDVSLSTKAQSLALDQKQDIFYVLIKPLNPHPFQDYESTSYVQASPTLESKLIDKHPNLTNSIGSYIYGKNYDKAVIEANKQLRITTRFVEHKEPQNLYDFIVNVLMVIFISLVIITIVLSIFTDDGDDNDDSSNNNAALTTTNISMLNSTIINNMN